MTPYDRQSYMRNGWEYDGVDWRQRILRDKSHIEVTTSDTGKVVHGLWTDPYSWSITRRASDTDIEHVLPLKLAHTWGMDVAPDSMKEAFAHDPLHLIPANKGANRARGAKSIVSWIPATMSFWDEWSETIFAVADKYPITIPPSEAAILTRIGQLGTDFNKGIRSPLEVLNVVAHDVYVAHKQYGWWARKWDAAMKLWEA